MKKNKTKKTVDCSADLVLGTIHCADYGICGRDRFPSAGSNIP